MDDTQWKAARYPYGDGQVVVITGFVGPYGLTPAADGNLYVSDLKEARVLRFDAGLRPTGWLGARSDRRGDSSGWHRQGRPAPGREPGMLQMAHSLDFDRNGRAFVADYAGKVAVYQPDGRYAGDFFGSPPSSSLRLQGPANASFDAGGNLWISDFDGHRVYKFAPDFGLVGWLGARPGGRATAGFAQEGMATASREPGGLDRPHMVQVDAMGNIYVVERGNHRVQKFRPDGTSVGWIGAKADGSLTHGWEYRSDPAPSALPGGFDAPVSLQIVDGRYLLVADNGNHRIQRFTLQGRFAGWLGGRQDGSTTQGWAMTGLSMKGSAPGMFSAPYDARMREGRLYVADGHNARVQVFQFGPAGSDGMQETEPDEQQ